MSLLAFLRSPHENMPKLILTDEALDDPLPQAGGVTAGWRIGSP